MCKKIACIDLISTEVHILNANGYTPSMILTRREMELLTDLTFGTLFLTDGNELVPLENVNDLKKRLQSKISL